MINIQPFRMLAARYKMDFPNPWSKLFNASKPILKKSIVPKTGYSNFILGVIDFAGILREILLPFWVIHIYPGNHKVYIHNFFDN
jgi:hypothetical protein